MTPRTLDGQMIELSFRLAEVERRLRNRKRKGTIAEVGEGENAGKYRVKLSEQDGKPFLTDWIRSRVIAAGSAKIDVPRRVNEQVDVISENGDLTDAEIDLSSYSEENPRENTDNVPVHIKVGDAVFAMSGDEIRLVAGKIILDAEVHLGGEGGALLHRKGDVDNDGDIAVGSASRVYAV